jgi:hypothetical protein
MTRWITIGSVAAGGLLLVGAGALAVGALAWRRESASSIARLRNLGEDPATRSAPIAFDSLPAPVVRYFAFALANQDLAARTVHIRWTGEFRMRPDAGWVPFSATQDFTVHRPGFVWDARIHMLPLVSVRVRDAYTASTAFMLGRVGGLVTVVNQSGSSELAQSALARWMGEAVWFPMALLPRDGVRWQAIDDSTARIVVDDGATTASAELHFAPSGEVIRMSALRYRDVNGTSVLTPFEGLYRDYARIGGVMVPTNAEVAWLLPEERYAYWRARPKEIRYQPGVMAEAGAIK